VIRLNRCLSFKLYVFILVAVETSVIQWIEQFSSEREVLEKLGKELGIHPLAIEDCLHSNQRAKFDDFESHQLLVWFTLINGKIYELEFVILPKTILLVTNGPPPTNESWFKYLNLSNHHRDCYHLLYQALDRSMDHSAENIIPLFSGIDEFERNLFEGIPDPRDLLVLKRRLSDAEYALGYLPSVVGQFQRFLNPKDDLRWRLRDLLDHCERVHQRLVFHRTQVGGAMEMYWGITAKRTNDRIKKLTLITSIAIPLTFWTSFWGMNFEALPFSSRTFFMAALVLMILSTTGVYFFLRRKGYWEKE
jgi:magnesium transporter